MRTRTLVFAIPLLAATWTAFGMGGGSMTPTPSGSAQDSRLATTPEEQARKAHNYGVKAVEKADALAADAARQTDERKRQKLAQKAQDSYADALKKFARATELQPGMHESWNYAGYSHRKLGHFDAALAAYDRALTLKPGYAEAIEYRAHAYLGLGRLSDAKEAYLSLYAGNRALAAKLLSAMQEWVGANRGASGADAAAVESFASWVGERSAIAAQTAGLTREGAAAGWR
jgi:tetratricopeptide (TPR) repeat protein